MKSIEPPDSHHLSAAIGWLGLGDWREAVVELESISPELREHPGVLSAWYEVYAKGEKWDAAVEVARALAAAHPREPQFYIWHAYATRRMTGGGIPQAREILDKARPLIRKEPLIAYNLGCYECQLGHLDAAWQWLEKALAAGDRRTVKKLALEDRDLQPLWDKIREM